MKAANKDLSHLYKRQQILQLATFTLVTIFIWIGFSLFRSQKKTSISAEQTLLSQPLTPSINTQVIESLEQKNHYTQEQLQDFPIYKILVENTKTNKKTATKSAQTQTEIESSIPTSLGSILESTGSGQTQ
jgi:hypothetical protein